MKQLKLVITLVLITALMGCSGMSNRDKGAVIGAGTGAAIGGIIGKATGNTALGAIIGTAVGGVAGAYIGNYMDKQAAEIERDLEGATVTRVGEGIKITFDSGLLFDINSAELQPAAVTNLTNLAEVLNKYEDTVILIEGHTDATGSDEHNLELSRSRAQSVTNHLVGVQVDATRFTIMGYGESQPIMDNETVEGRQANRRVELAIMANDKLKKIAAEKAE